MLENGLDASHAGLTTLLHDLIQTPMSAGDRIQVFSVLIKYGFDINSARRGDGVTPLHVVCQLGMLPLFKFLIVHGAGRYIGYTIDL